MSQTPFLGAFRGLVLSFAVAAITSYAAEGPGANSLASVPVAELPQGPIYWQLDTYPTRAEAETLGGPRSTVVEAFVKVWLFTLAEPGWRPTAGVRAQGIEMPSGNGSFARALARRGARVAGIDISPRMTEHAKRQETAEPLDRYFERGAFEYTWSGWERTFTTEGFRVPRVPYVLFFDLMRA